MNNRFVIDQDFLKVFKNDCLVGWIQLRFPWDFVPGLDYPREIVLVFPEEPLNISGNVLFLLMKEILYLQKAGFTVEIEQATK